MKLYQWVSYFFVQKITRYISHLINLLIILFVRPEKLSERQQDKLDLLERKKVDLANEIYDYNKIHEHLCYTCKDVCCAVKGEGDRHEPVDFLLDKNIRSNKEKLSQKNSEWYEIKIKREHIKNPDKAAPCPYLDPMKGCKLLKNDRPILCPSWFCKEFFKVWSISEVATISGFVNKSVLIRCSVLWIAVLSFFRIGKSK